MLNAAPVLETHNSSPVSRASPLSRASSFSRLSESRLGTAPSCPGTGLVGTTAPGETPSRRGPTTRMDGAETP